MNKKEKTMHELTKEFPQKTYAELERYRNEDRQQEAGTYIMGEMTEFFTPFATGVQWSHLNDKVLNKKLIEFAMLQKTKNTVRSISNVGGFQSEMYNPHTETNPIIQTFIKAVTPHLERYVERYEIKQPYTVSPANAWININGKGDYNLQHSHAGGINACDFSGTYYAQVPKNSGDLVLVNPDTVALQQKTYFYENNKYNPFNSSKYTIAPKPMDLILFSSHIHHHVLPSQNSKQFRISYAFNFDICKS